MIFVLIASSLNSLKFLTFNEKTNFLFEDFRRIKEQKNSANRHIRVTYRYSVCVLVVKLTNKFDAGMKHDDVVLNSGSIVKSNTKEDLL